MEFLHGPSLAFMGLGELDEISMPRTAGKGALSPFPFSAAYAMLRTAAMISFSRRSSDAASFTTLHQQKRGGSQ
jgi:hypothetical protein